jgi:hypothetical protein
VANILQYFVFRQALTIPHFARKWQDSREAQGALWMSTGFSLLKIKCGFISLKELLPQETCL